MVRLLFLGTLLSSSTVLAQAPRDPDLASGPFARMSMLYEKTFLGIDVARIDVQFDQRTQEQLRQLAQGESYSNELGAKLARVALDAQEVLVQLRFLRNVSLSDFLDGARRNLTRARDALEAIDPRDGADCASVLLQSALSALGEISGRDVAGEVIDRIFEKFCVGK